jgi:hypothetical protein
MASREHDEFRPHEASSLPDAIQRHAAFVSRYHLLSVVAPFPVRSLLRPSSEAVRIDDRIPSSWG